MDAEVAARILVEEYSRMAEAYEAHVVPQNRTLVRRLLELARLRPGEQLLDLGCGPGNLAIEAIRGLGERSHVEGIDLAEGMIRTASAHAARRGLQNVAFRVMDCRELAYPSGAFDVIASCLGIPSIGHPRCFGEAYRVLRRGGRFVFCLGSGGGTGSEVGKAFREALEAVRLPDPPEEVRRVLEARDVVNATGESAAIRNAEMTIQALGRAGFEDTQAVAEPYPAEFAGVEGYLDYQLAWGDNEREWRAMEAVPREAFLRDFESRVARFVRPNGFAYTREVLFYAAVKRM